MVVRLAVSHATAGLIAVGLGVVLSGEAVAQANVLRECGSQYQAAKAANELAGQSWQDFLKACRTKLTEQGQAATPAAETKPAEAATPAGEAKPAEAAKPAETPAAEAPAANPLKPPPTTAAPAAETPAAKPMDARAATRARQKACAAEWKEKKKELVAADKKLTWPKFWSACNKRLKESGQ